MSALWAPVDGWDESGLPARPKTRPAKPARLRAVPKSPARLARIPFMLVLIALFGLGMTGLLMLNTTLQNQVFQARVLTRQATLLTYTQADLESQIDQRAAPQELARRASAYGLRPNPNPAFIVLPKGKIVGKSLPVTGKEVPTLIVKTPAQQAAEHAAALAKQKAKLAQKQAAARAKVLAAQRKAELKAAQEKAAATAKAAALKKAAATKKAATKTADTSKAASTKKTDARGRG